MPADKLHPLVAELVDAADRDATVAKLLRQMLDLITDQQHDLASLHVRLVELDSAHGQRRRELERRLSDRLDGLERELRSRAYCRCERPVIDVEHDAGCRRCGLPVDFTPERSTTE